MAAVGFASTVYQSSSLLNLRTKYKRPLLFQPFPSFRYLCVLRIFSSGVHLPTFKRILICLKYRETLHLYEECRMPQVSVFDFFLQQALEFLLCDPFPLPAQMFKDFGCCTFSRALRWCLFLRKARKLTQKCTYLAIVLRLYFFQLFIAGRKKYFIFGLYSILNLPGISFDG